MKSMLFIVLMCFVSSQELRRTHERGQARPTEVPNPNSCSSNIHCPEQYSCERVSTFKLMCIPIVTEVGRPEAPAGRGMPFLPVINSPQLSSSFYANWAAGIVPQGVPISAYGLPYGQQLPANWAQLPSEPPAPPPIYKPAAPPAPSVLYNNAEPTAVRATVQVPYAPAFQPLASYSGYGLLQQFGVPNPAAAIAAPATTAAVNVAKPPAPIPFYVSPTTTSTLATPLAQQFPQSFGGFPSYGQQFPQFTGAPLNTMQQFTGAPQFGQAAFGGAAFGAVSGGSMFTGALSNQVIG